MENFIRYLLVVGVVLGHCEIGGKASAKPEKDSFDTVSLPDEPFWREAKAQKKMREERAVLVSVRARPSGQKKKLSLKGAGLVKAPVDVAYAVARDFKSLQKASPYIRKMQYDKETQRLFMHSKAYNYHARMQMQLQLSGDKSDTSRQIHYQVIEGVFEGLTGVLHFKDDKRRKTEISMTAFYEYDKLPVPSLFVEFGLEVILQKIATRLRSVVEKRQNAE